MAYMGAKAERKIPVSEFVQGVAKLASLFVPAASWRAVVLCGSRQKSSKRC